ncbi:MAG: hypothetical protein WA981_08970 [Glaciecola sp.]
MNKSTATLPLLPGETPLPKAPAVVLDDGTNCIPQHFLSYQHTVASVQDIVAHIEFDDNFVLFVDEDNASIFIQVGIIGKDNYQHVLSQEAQKIVYGRRWRVEPQLPSSEIIQTAFLALIKAREHEVRELFKYSSEYTQQLKAQRKVHTTTPFSCHHDLPLIAMSQATNSSITKPALDLGAMQNSIAKIRYDHASFNIQQLIPLQGQQHLLSFTICPSKLTTLPELINTPNIQHMILDDISEDGLMYGLMDTLLDMSQRYIEEYFTFKGFARFSRQHSIEKISALSAKTRIRESDENNTDFASAFADANYETDTTRVPRIRAGKLGNKIKQQLQTANIKYGILPKSGD